MGRRNGNGQPQYPSIENLVPSDNDLVQLGLSVEQRFLELTESYIRIKGIRLVIPTSLQPDAMRWRRMVMRHRNGDYRNTPSELKATRAFAQWTLDINCEMRGQVKQQIVWKS